MSKSTESNLKAQNIPTRATNECTRYHARAFYAYKAVKHRRIALLTINDWPTDWQHLKSLAAECSVKAYQEYKVTIVLMTLELHLPGKFTKATKPGDPRSIST